VHDAKGEFSGLGAWSPVSQIRIRMWCYDNTPINAGFFEDRIASAIALRKKLNLDSNACRLVHAEADRLPGLTVDQYDNWLICQFTAAGVERWKETIFAALRKHLPDKNIYERSDPDVRAREGLPPVEKNMDTNLPLQLITITEGACRFEVDLLQGHKTGFYLDQRSNRKIVAGYASGAEMLNVFSYTGGFGITAAKAGARSITHVDASSAALDLARRNMTINNQSNIPTEFINGNAFEILRKFRDARRSFDLIVLDPPKFADAKSYLMAACRGYKDINLLGLKLVRSGGLLATFSCSGAVSSELFQKVIADAAVDAGRTVQVISQLQQASDHPVNICIPEGRYLKGLLCRVL
jgi:23S rRNA (cytosine1962-C5)-methyltransferase